MLLNALVILRNARSSVLLYGAVLTAYLYLVLGAANALNLADLLKPGNAYGAAIQVGLALADSALIAVLMCVCFSRIARTVEGALWRVQRPADAIRRYFALWFILMLVRTLAVRIVELATGPLTSPEDGLPTLFTELSLTCWIVPIGAFIMFHGRGERLTREDIREGFHAMGIHFGTVIVMVFINFLLLLGTEIAREAVTIEIRPLFAFTDALRVMYIFACAWVMGIYHRDHYEPDNDLDF
jgi:hypothetical protein